MRKIKRILKKAGVIILTAAMLAGQAGFTALAEEVVEVKTEEDKAADNEVGILEEPSSEKQIAEETPEIEKEESETNDSHTISGASEKPEDHSDEAEPFENTVSSDNADPEKESISEDRVDRNRFEKSKTINGVTITVEAEEGVFPEDAVLSGKKASRSQEKQAEEAVEEERPEDQNVAVSYTYDIKVLDKEGNELQPADEAGVKVLFKIDEVSDENLTTNIYHIKENNASSWLPPMGEAGGGTPTDEGDQNNTSSVACGDTFPSEGKALNHIAEKLTVETDGDTATAETDGFSLYTVEFTYNDLQYVMPGDSEIALSEILDAVGLTGDVSDIKVSDSSLFSATRLKVSDDGKKPARDGDGSPIADDNGVWFVTAHEAFSTNEWMKITINDVVYEITVTDDPGAAEITSWADLQSKMSAGGEVALTQNLIAPSNGGTLSVPAGKNVTLDLKGFTLDGTVLERVMEVEGSLAITDSGDGGTILGSNGDEIIFVDGGSVTLNGGVLSGSNEGKVINMKSGTLTVNGGKIHGSKCINCVEMKNGNMVINGGEITAVNGGGVESHTLQLHAGSLTVNGGEVSARNCDYAVYLDYSVDFIMNDGTVTGDRCGYVVGSRQSFSMSGGTISGTNISYGIVGAGYVFTMTGGTISGSGTEYGGVFAAGSSLFPTPEINISGASEIDGGIRIGTKVINIPAPLTNQTPIGITFKGNLQPDNPKVVTSGLSGNGGLANFKSNMTGAGLRINADGELELYRTMSSEWDSLQTKLSEGGTVKLEKDYTATASDFHLEVPSGKTVVLDLNGHTIDGSGLKEEHLIYYGDNNKENGVIFSCGTLTIEDSGTGGKIIGADQLPALSLYGGDCTLNSGTIIGGDHAQAVYDISGITMNGGKIVGGRNAAAVYSKIADAKCITMTGGEIEGKIYLQYTDFKMSGGSIYYEGGAVELQSGNDRTDAFYMSGGTISGNGGISVVYSNFYNITMTGGTIKSTDERPGIEVMDGSFTLRGGEVSSEAGYGIDILGSAEFSLSGAPVIGGGVCLGVNDVIRIAGALTNENPIKVRTSGILAAGQSVVFTSGLGSYGTADNFVSDINGAFIAKNTDGELELRKEDSAGTEWETLQNLLSAGGETVTLDRDYTAVASDDPLQIPYGERITLDLNGFTIDGTALDTTVLNIEDDNTGLTIKDSSGDGTGKLRGDSALAVGFGTLRLESGRVEGKTSVYGGSYTIDGGVISGSIQNSGGSLTMNAGSVSCDSGTYAVSVKSENEEYRGSFTMIGGTLSGSGIDSVVEIEGDKFASFTMSGGTVSGTGVNQTVLAGGLFNMTGGNVSGSGQCGAVKAVTRSSFHVSGTPKIEGGVYLCTGSAVNVDDALTNEASIPVITEKKPKTDAPITITYGFSANGGAAASGVFSTGLAGLAVEMNNSKGELELKKDSATDWDGLQDLISNGGTVTLDKDYTATAADDSLMIPLNTQVTLNLGEYTIDGSALNHRPVFYFEAGYLNDAALTIEGSGINGKISSGSNYAVEIGNDGTLVINGGKISGTADVIRAGGKNLDNKGELKLSGSPVIEGNVLLGKNHVIEITGELANTSPVKVKTDTSPVSFSPVVITRGLSSHSGSRTKIGSASSDLLYTINSAGEAVLVKKLGITLPADTSLGSTEITGYTPVQKFSDPSSGNIVERTQSLVFYRDRIALKMTPVTDYALGILKYSYIPEGNYSPVTNSVAFTETGGGYFTASFSMPAGNVTLDASWKKKLTHSDIAVTIPEQAYTGNALTPVITVKDANGGSEKTLVEGKDYTVTLPEGRVNAGSYTVTLTGKGEDYTGQTTKTFTINPASVTLTANSRNTDIYDGVEKTVTGFASSVAGLAFADTVTASGCGTDVGEYDVTFSGVTLNETKDTTGNYVVTGTTDGKLTINPASVTLIANSGTETYSGAEQTLTGFTSSVAGLAFADTVTASGSGTNAGEYDVIFSGVTLNETKDTTGNYVVTGTTKGKLAITPKTLKVTSGITAENKTYNGTNEATVLCTGATFDGIIGNPELTVSGVSGAFADVNAGEGKTVTLNYTGAGLGGADAGNYALSVSGNQSTAAADITKADAPASSIVIVKKYLYSRDNSASFTLTGLPADSGTVSWNAPVVTGDLTFNPVPLVSDTGMLTYTVKSGAVGSTGTIQVVAETQNYNDVTFTVNLKPVDQTPVKLKDGSSVSLINNTLKYGQKLSTLQFNTTEFVSDDTDQDMVEGTLTWKEPDTIPDAGTTPAAWIFKPTNAVYIPYEGALTVNIEKAAINPSVSITGWTYGDPANSPSVTGNTGNGMVSYIYSIKGEDSFSPTVPTNAGNFTVKAEIEESMNYLSGTATADFTIAQADSSVKKEAAAVSGLEYDGEVHKLITAGEGDGGTMHYALGSDDSNAPTDGFSDALPEGKDAGTYYVWSKIKGDDNHKDTAAAFACSVSIDKNSHHPTVSLDAVTGVDNTREIDLSEYLEEEGTPGSPVIKDGDDIFEGSPAVNGNILRYTTVNDEGIIGKTATISVPVNNSKNYESYNIDITVKVDDKFKQDLSFAESEVTLKVDETFTNELSGAKTAVSYNSSDEKIATVDGTGKVTAVGAGTAVITATAAETDEYFPASESYTVTVIEEKEEKKEENEETALPEKKPDKVPFTETGENYASKEDNFAPVTGGSGGDIKNLLLDFSKVSESSVDPSGLKMTVINGSKLVTKGKLKDANSAKASGGVKVKVDKKTLIPKITCKKSGSVTLIMEDDKTYTINFTVEKPKAQKAAKNMSKGGAPATKTVADLFGTHIDAGELTIVKQKQSQASVSDNMLIVDPAEKDSIKLQYKYLNKSYKMTVKVK